MIHPQAGSRSDKPGEHSLAAGGGRDVRGKLSLARLPMMPQVLVRLLDLFHRDDVNFTDIADVIRRDAAMAARIFTVATSATHHGRARPANLDQCLTLLGVSTVKTIVINESIVQVFRRFTKDRDFDLRRFWEHSLQSALIARDLARALGYASPEEAYLGGLMHDVGQLAILAADSDAYAPILLAAEDHDELCRREQAMFDLTHAEVGAWLVEKWELDSLLADGILYHHDPVERIVEAHALIRIMYLANRLTTVRGEAVGKREAELAARCGAVGVDLRKIIDRSGEEVVVLARELGIELAVEGSAPDGAEAFAASTDDLAARVRDVLLVDSVFGDAAPAEGLDGALHGIARAARLLFGVQPALCFLPEDGDPDHFVARPLASRWARAGQLMFARGRSSAEVARTIEHGVLFLAPGAYSQNLLDEQLLRMVGGTGLLLVPLRGRGRCLGILVCSFEGAYPAEAWRLRLPCLEHFAQAAATLLGQATAPTAAAPAPTPARTGQPGDGSREHLQRVVHEIGNPLAIIQNYLATLKGKYEKHDIGVRELSIVSEEITRVSRILQNALQGPGESTPEIRSVNLNALIEDLVALCRSSGFVAPSVSIETELASSPPELLTDGDRLKQLLLNLLKNSVEAMAAAGGVLRLATAPWGGGIGTSHVEIRIEDSGPGIPPDVLTQLYQPVASTKGQNHLGVGLSIVGQLVRDLGALINCRSSSAGTCFQLLIPLAKR